LASAGRKNVFEKFSSEKVAQHYYDLYPQIISDGITELKIDLDDQL
jgi:hypothetical protein